MDTALIVITLLSIAVTGALLVYAARLQRLEREREDARVAALAMELQLEPDATPPPRRPASVSIEPFDPPLDLGDHVVAVDSERRTDASLFERPRATTSAKRIGMVSAGALVVAVAAGGVYLTSAHSRAAGSPTAGRQVTRSARALELVRLEQEKTHGTLTVRGVVRNPDGAARRRGVSATVFVFDGSGAFVASARAGIDDQTLEAGDESPFTVKVPGAAAGTRYRVSFRIDREIVPHVDRRESAVDAGSGTTTGRREASASGVRETREDRG